MTTTTETRELTQDRKEQGFTSQAQLDAFFAYLDHSKCECCQKTGGVAFDDGFQPTQILCSEGQRLYSIYAKM